MVRTRINTRLSVNQLVLGFHVYRDIAPIHSLSSSTDSPSVIDVIEPHSDSQGFESISLRIVDVSFEFLEGVYYAFIKTGQEPCGKGCYPKLSLFGDKEKHTEFNMKLPYRVLSPSTNNPMALEKHQFDVFQWQDDNIGNIERIQLQLFPENGRIKCQWPVEWILVIHHGYSFTGWTI